MPISLATASQFLTAAKTSFLVAAIVFALTLNINPKYLPRITFLTRFDELNERYVRSLSLPGLSPPKGRRGNRVDGVNLWTLNIYKLTVKIVAYVKVSE